MILRLSLLTLALLSSNSNSKSLVSAFTTTTTRTTPLTSRRVFGVGRVITLHQQQQRRLYSTATGAAPAASSSSSSSTEDASPTPAAAPAAATVPPSKSSRRSALLHLNQELNQWAELAGNTATVGGTDYPTTNMAIAAALQCETLWREHAVMDTDSISFNTVLKAWSRCCQTLVEQKSSPHHANILPTVPPTSTSTSTSTNKNQESLLQQLKSVDITPLNIYTPADAANHAETLLRNQIMTNTDNDKDEDDENEDEDKNENEEDTRSSIKIKPDTASFNIVMDAWSKSRDVHAPDKVQALMDLLKDNSNNNNKNNNNNNNNRNGHGLEPDAISYSTLVDALAYSTRPDRLETLHQIWDSLKNDPTSPVRPTVRIMNSILHAYSKSAMEDFPNAWNYAEKANSILQEMKQTAKTNSAADQQPDVMTYTVVMECWARCGNWKAAVQAEELFAELQKLNQEHNGEDARFRPSIYTYTTLIKAWARAAGADQAATRAEALLQELLDNDTKMAENPNLHLAIPNAMAFTAVLQCWARSKHVKDKATRALKLLQQMKQLVKERNNNAAQYAPNLMTYNTAIDACARVAATTSSKDSKQQLASLQIAFAILKAIEMDEVIQPNHVTYATLLKAVGSLLPPGPERNKVATAVFNKAIHAGQVHTSVLRSLQKATDADTLQALLATATTAATTATDQSSSSLTLETETKLLNSGSPAIANNNHLHPKKSHHMIDYDRIPSSWNKNVRT